MLLQSDEEEIHLLPALPSAWPEGKVRGLRARGGFEVDVEWKSGKVISYTVQSDEPKPVRVRVNGSVEATLSQKSHL
jgi:alpha-L-fucosidase 2